MALTLPKGIQFGFANISKSVTAAITAFSNGKPPQIEFAEGAAALPDDSVVLVRASGWPLANNKVSVLDTNDMLRGLDTTDLDLFPATGFGIASVVAVGDPALPGGGWTDFTQQGDPTTSGGEQQFWTGTLLEDPLGRQISLPTFKNAKQLTIPLYFDPSEPWYDRAKAADAKGEPVVLRAKMPNGDVLYWYGYLSFDADPSIAANTPMGNTATFTILGESTLVRRA